MTNAQAKPRQEEQAPKGLPWGRVLLGAALAGLVTLAVASAWRFISAPHRFPLQAVRLTERPQHVSEAELREAITPYLNKGMLGLDVARIRQALETLPWVAEAAVRRQWPGVLQIALRERVAAARWGGDALLSDQAVVFAPAPASFPQGLPQLSGPEGSEDEVLARYRRLVDLLGKVSLELSELHLDSRRSWRAVLADGVVIQLGSGAGDAAAERFVRAFPKIGIDAGKRLAQVDLRYPNGFALSWGKAPATALQ